jgi:limonene-1,2-epoxide hydrolase
VSVQHEQVVRRFLDCVAARDFEAALEHYADNAAVSVAAWHEPLVGKEAIRKALESETGLRDYRYRILNMASIGPVAFLEVIDEFRHGDHDLTMHWCGVWEIDSAGKITARRDYWDTAELEARLA